MVTETFWEEEEGEEVYTLWLWFLLSKAKPHNAPGYSKYLMKEWFLSSEGLLLLLTYLGWEKSLVSVLVPYIFAMLRFFYVCTDTSGYWDFEMRLAQIKMCYNYKIHTRFWRLATKIFFKSTISQSFFNIDYMLKYYFGYICLNKINNQININCYFFTH